MRLIHNHHITAAIIYGNTEDPVTMNAVSEYGLFLRLCTGDDPKTYPFVPLRPYESYVLLQADEKVLNQFHVTIPRERFQDDTIYIRIKQNYIVLDGGKRGRLYAVYEFLERFCGVRFYAPDQIRTPSVSDLNLTDCEIIYTPPIPYRNLYSYDTRRNREYCVRLRLNTENDPLGLLPFGGGLDWALPGCHTTFRWLFSPDDPEAGFARHPEYYSFRPEKGGRIGRYHPKSLPQGEGEICWSNPNVIDILTERIKQWILDEPRMRIFSITQNDWQEYCQCNDCRKLAEKYGSVQNPRWSAPIVAAVNQIARRIADWKEKDSRVKDREIFLETFAYQYSADPPRGMRVEDNVIIRLCTHDACFYHTFEDAACPINRKFIRAFQGWKAIAKNVFIWDYANNHYWHIGYNTILRVIAPNVRYFAKNHIFGIFEEMGDVGRLGPAFCVKQYLYAKVLWNPELDFEAEYREAMEFIYGRAAPYLMEVERRFAENTDQIQNFHPYIYYTFLPEYFSDSFLQTATQLYHIALEKAETASCRLLIQRDFWCLKWIKMYVRKGENYVEMQELLDEAKELGIDFPKLKGFARHFFGGPKSDFFRSEIEDRLRKDASKKLQDCIREEEHGEITEIL